MPIRSLSERDQGFLWDRYQFANDTRYVVSRALYETSMTESSPWLNGENDWRKQLLVARIFNEYMGSIEDLAALIHAVKNRIPNGIMWEYVNYNSGDIGQVYTAAQAWISKPSLAELLGIQPDEVDALKEAHRVAGDDPDEVLAGLNQIPQHVVGLGRAYLSKFDPAVVGPNMVEPLTPTGRHIRSMQGAHNKIKHGSLLVGSMEKLLTKTEDIVHVQRPEFQEPLLVLIQVPTAGEDREALTASLPMRQEWVKDMVSTVESIRNMTAAVLATCATLIKDGIWRY